MEALLETPSLARERSQLRREPQSARQSRSVKPARTDHHGIARFAYPVAVVAALVWAGGLAAFVAGFQTQFGAFDYSPLQWAVIGLLAILPATFILLSAFALREGAKLAGESRRARALADDLAIPAALAADQTVGAMEAMRREIEKASQAALAAREPIVALREALSIESSRLTEAAIQAQTTGLLLTDILGRERTQLGEMAGALQLQAAEAAEALARQARIVAEASDLAQTQLDEAQASLTARAADLAVAAGDARQASEIAGQALAQQIERLGTTGAVVANQVQSLSADLATERGHLAALTETLRADQDDLTVRLETQRARLTEAAAEARGGAASLTEASIIGADALRSLIAVAAEEVRLLAETAHREQSELDAKARAAVGLFSGMVAEERAAMEAQARAAIDDLAAAADEARLAASGHVESAAQAAKALTNAARVGLEQVAGDVVARIDNLGEAAFAASQQADQAFDSRIASARRMIEQSSALMEETGERSAQRVEQGLAATRAAMADMEAFLVEIDQRMSGLPEQARAQAAAVRDAVEAGVGDLTAAARRAAEETQAIDAAFQERVRRNYEILSDAVRLMGRVAGAADLSRADAAPAPAPAPTAPALKPAALVKAASNGADPMDHEPPVERAVERAAMPEYRAAAGGDRSIRVSLGPDLGASARMGTADATEALRPAALSEPFAESAPADPAPRRAEPATAAAAGLRPRLKLTTPPAASKAGGDPASDEWTWKDLLSSVDEGDDDETLADRLIAEIVALGVDAAALLPAPRIDEIAAALQTGDASGAREVVRRLAPAAVRRLSRRVLTDKVLRTEADRYVRRYEELLSDSAQRDREGYMTAALLGSDPGRAFLLLDAAVGDLH